MATSLANARVWLDSYSPTPIIPPRSRSAAELLERRAELDAILATAPADQRHTIKALATGQLTPTDVSEVLRLALASQGDRLLWILEHWPHIVESAEVDLSLIRLVQSSHVAQVETIVEIESGPAAKTIEMDLSW